PGDPGHPDTGRPDRSSSGAVRSRRQRKRDRKRRAGGRGGFTPPPPPPPPIEARGPPPPPPLLSGGRASALPSGTPTRGGGVRGAHLGLVHRLPVVAEPPAGVAGVGVQAPVGVADVMLLDELHQGGLPLALGVVADRAAKLTQQHWGDVLLVQVGPVRVPDA